MERLGRDELHSSIPVSQCHDQVLMQAVPKFLGNILAQ